MYRLHCSSCSSASWSVCWTCRTPGSCVSWRCLATTAVVLTGCLNCPPAAGTLPCGRCCGRGRFEVVLAGVTVTTSCRWGAGRAGSLKVTAEWRICCCTPAFSWPGVICECVRLWPGVRATGLRMTRETLEEAWLSMVPLAELVVEGVAAAGGGGGGGGATAAVVLMLRGARGGRTARREAMPGCWAVRCHRRAAGQCSAVENRMAGREHCGRASPWSALCCVSAGVVQGLFLVRWVCVCCGAGRVACLSPATGAVAQSRHRF